MASHRLNPLYAIKECSTCGSLYTKECCSIGSFEDKILTPVPDSSPRCARCGTPVDGPSCRGCAFLRKKFDEDLLTYCVENGIFQDFQNTSESSDDNTNVVNALREPCVVNQDPGMEFFVDNAFGKSVEKVLHYGYNCPPKDPIISKPEPCNQTINEIPQTLPSLDPSCYSLPHVSKPNFVDNSPNFSYPPPQLQFETYLCELCGNNAHYGYDCSPQFQFIDPILEEFADELAHIAPIPPGIVEADLDDDTSSDDDDFEDVEYVSLEEVNEEKEFDLEDILQIQNVILREKLLNVHRLISNIESLKVNPTPDHVLKSPFSFRIPVVDSDAFFEESDTSLSHLDNSLPEFETFSYHTKETRSGITTTHANYSLPEYDSFLF
ncbi:hypothetical protein Tco_1319175 [Tanacetum coccineum]